VEEEEEEEEVLRDKGSRLTRFIEYVVVVVDKSSMIKPFALLFYSQVNRGPNFRATRPQLCTRRRPREWPRPPPPSSSSSPTLRRPHSAGEARVKSCVRARASPQPFHPRPPSPTPSPTIWRLEESERDGWRGDR